MVSNPLNRPIIGSKTTGRNYKPRENSVTSPPPPHPLPPPSHPPSLLHPDRRKIRQIESNAKCRYLKKLACKGILRQVFYPSRASSPPMTPYSPPPLKQCIRVYSIHTIHTGKGGKGRELTREKIRGAIVDKARQKYQHD